MSKEKKIKIEDAAEAVNNDIAGDAGDKEDIVTDGAETPEENVNSEETEEEATATEAGTTEEETLDEEKDPRDEKIAELGDKYIRLMAEFENFRKRTDKEKDQMFEAGARSVIEKVLPVIDNFERALDMVKEGGEKEAEADPFMDGMQKVYRQLMDELEKIGVRPIEAVGQEFNPDFHNAVMQVDSEEFDSGTVAQEMQKGYLYKESVVRHSMVGVAK